MYRKKPLNLFEPKQEEDCLRALLPLAMAPVPSVNWRDLDAPNPRHLFLCSLDLSSTIYLLLLG